MRHGKPNFKVGQIVQWADGHRKGERVKILCAEVGEVSGYVRYTVEKRGGLKAFAVWEERLLEIREAG